MRRIGIECMRCGARGHHTMGSDTRLRERRHVCGGRWRPIWWTKKYDQKARSERAASHAG